MGSPRTSGKGLSSAPGEEWLSNQGCLPLLLQWVHMDFRTNLLTSLFILLVELEQNSPQDPDTQGLVVGACPH